jgi:hypothetical protein
VTNIGSLLQHSTCNQLRNIEENGADLLELRTDAGVVYIRPSKWQRIRLQWTFRHFRVLPPQLLSRRDQRLIEKLSQSAVVEPTLPVRSSTVFGVVEKVRSKSPAPANRVVTLRRGLLTSPAFLAKPRISVLLSPDLSVLAKQTEEEPGVAKALAVRRGPFQQWGALGALAVVCFTVLASVYGIPLFSSAGHTRNALPTPIEHAANSINPPDLHPAATSPLRSSAKTASPSEELNPRIAPPPAQAMQVDQQPAPRADGPGQFMETASRSPVPAVDTVSDTTPAPIVPSATSERRFVAELPQGHFAHPVVSEPNLVGELRLKALIGADGSVKEVTVLSGSHKLAEAGMRAVRQWHYSPSQVLGGPVESETQIKMSFFGQDAVSIASVANGPASQLQ